MGRIAAARKDFPVLAGVMHGKPLVYLDTAATAQKPQAVIDAISTFYSKDYGTVHRAVYELAVHATKGYQETRIKAANFLNSAKPEEIIFTRGTTEAINLVAHSFGKAFIKPGDEIVISEVEHHSNIVPWQFLSQERGAVLKIIPVEDCGVLDLEAYKNLLNPKTKLVAVGHISNALGTIHPIKEMIALAHQAGAKILIDGAQAAPHMKVDVQDLDCDFYVFSGHKLYGPTGIGILYGKEDLLEKMPPYQGGGDMIENVTFDKTTYNVLPLKFEAGTPSIAEVIGLGAAIDYVNSFGLESIFQWEHALLVRATERLQDLPGVTVIGTAPKKGAIISFKVEGVHPLDIGTMLDLQGVAIRTGHVCAQPTMRRFGIEAVARVSFGLYNNQEDVDRFIASLKDVIRLLK